MPITNDTGMPPTEAMQLKVLRNLQVVEDTFGVNLQVIIIKLQNKKNYDGHNIFGRITLKDRLNFVMLGYHGYYWPVVYATYHEV